MPKRPVRAPTAPVAPVTPVTPVGAPQQALVDEGGEARQQRGPGSGGGVRFAHTAATASSVHPPAKTPRWRKSACSSGASRS